MRTTNIIEKIGKDNLLFVWIILIIPLLIAFAPPTVKSSFHYTPTMWDNVILNDGFYINKKCIVIWPPLLFNDYMLQCWNMINYFDYTDFKLNKN